MNNLISWIAYFSFGFIFASFYMLKAHKEGWKEVDGFGLVENTGAFLLLTVFCLPMTIAGLLLWAFGEIKK